MYVQCLLQCHQNTPFQTIYLIFEPNIVYVHECSRLHEVECYRSLQQRNGLLALEQMLMYVFVVLYIFTKRNEPSATFMRLILEIQL